MKKIYKLLSIACMLFCSALIAQPVLGTTDFAVNGTISWNTNSPCVATKTADVQGWLVSVSSTSNCGINQSNSGGFSDSNGRLQYLVGFGTLSQASFGTDDGSEFALQRLSWSCSTYSFANASIQFIGYRNGSPVPGATLTAITPTAPWGSTSNTTVVTFTNNLNFSNVDNVIMVPTQTCSSILAFEDITIGSPSICLVSPTVTLSGSTNNVCNGGSIGGATVSASGSGPFTYAWSPSGGTASSISGRTSGIYTVVVTNSCSLSSALTVTISQPSALVTSTAVTNVACNGGSNGVASITASGGAGSYTYSWSTGNTTSAITGKLAGAYTATVTDANSCTSTKTAVITQPSALVTSTAVTNVSCNGGSNGVASITASGGAGSYTYSWSTGNTTSAITGKLAGAYTATVTDANSCTSINNAVITQPSALVTSTAVTNVACNGGSNGVASITASGGAGGYTYLWSNGGTTSAITGLLAGAYSATVTDANSCASIKSATVTQPTALVTTTAVTTISCNGGSNGNATITASGGVGGYTYLWSNAAATSAVSSLLAGAYSATVTDANSCTSIKSVSVTQPPALATTTTVINASCNGGTGSATITASGGTGAYTYLWSSGATTSVVSGFVAGAYTATVTDANSCTGTKTVIIAQPSALILTATATTPTVCSGSTTTLTANGNGGTGTISYTWTSGPTTSSYIVSPTVTTAYTVTASDVNNCSMSTTLGITAVSLPTITVNNPTTCAGSSVTIIPNGANTYTISGGSNIVSPVTTSTYSVTGTAANGCVSSNTAISTVSVNAASTLYINSGAVCPGNSFILIPSGASTYTITGGTFTVTPSANTSYSLTGTDANGCVAGNTAVATVSVVNTLTLSVSGATNVCSGRTTTLTATGASSYSWSTGITTNTVALSPSVNTTYTIYGVSGTCSNNAVVTLSVLTTPTVIVNNATICSGNSVIITPTGSPTYTITGGSYTVSPNTTTSYSVTGTDANGCISNPAVATISVNTTPTLTVNSATICSGNTLAIVPQGAGTYTITGGNFTVSPTITTSYSVTGTGTNGCAASNMAVFTVSVKTTPTVSVNSASICAGSSVIITPIGAATYTISGGSFTVSPLTTTIYSVTGTSTNGCISADAVSSVTVYALPTITVNSGVVCAGDSFTMIPSGAATYTFSNGSNIILNPAVTANYSATGTSAEGCPASNTAVATVSVVNTLTINITGNTTICTGQTATLTANGANTYSWSTGDLTSTVEFTPAATADYTVVGTTGTCSNTAIVSVSVNPLPTVTVNNGQTCNGISFVILPTGADTYSITGNTFTVTPTTTESYTVTGTNLNGCVSAGVVSTVTVNALPVVTVSTSNAIVCVNETTSLTAGGAATYSWSTNQTDMEITITPTIIGSETYTVWGTDANGCVGTATLTQVADACLSINTINASLPSVKVYPNPTPGLFTIETAVNATITVINVLGQSVFNETITNTTTEISISHLKNGVYFVKINDNGKQKIVKVVKE